MNDVSDILDAVAPVDQREGWSIKNSVVEPHGRMRFVLRFKTHESRMHFQLFDVTAWDNTENYTPLEVELHAQGQIKWDGCSHVYFGEIEEDGQSQDGYLHLHGRFCWENHIRAMAEVYNLARAEIPSFSDDEADYGDIVVDIHGHEKD